MILKSSRAENTSKKYTCYFNKWKRWCEQFEEVKYLASLYQQEESADVMSHVIEQFNFSINLILQITFSSDLCENIAEAAKRYHKEK